MSSALDLAFFKLTRRRLLGAAAVMAAAASASAFLPPNVRRALAKPPPTDGTLKDIKHVVMLMQENRSFDHYFGTMAGVRGFDDPAALKLSYGKSVFYHSPALPAPAISSTAPVYEAAYLPKPTLPGADQKLPSQEKGQRKRLPRNAA